MPDRKPAPQVDSAALLSVLRARHTPPRWVFFEELRNAAGFDATCTLDAFAMDTWPSGGLETIGYEIKTSRADLLRELRNGAKGRAACAVVDRFYIVAAHGVVGELSEIPAGWGVLILRGKRLCALRETPPPQDPLPPIDRDLVAVLLRRASKPAVAALLAARDGARLESEPMAELSRRLASAQNDLQSLRGSVDRFENASGVRVDRWDAKAIGDAVRAIRAAANAEEAVAGAVAAATRTLANTRERLEIAERYLAAPQKPQGLQ